MYQKWGGDPPEVLQMGWTSGVVYLKGGGLHPIFGTSAGWAKGRTNTAGRSTERKPDEHREYEDCVQDGLVTPQDGLVAPPFGDYVRTSLKNVRNL